MAQILDYYTLSDQMMQIHCRVNLGSKLISLERSLPFAYEIDSFSITCALCEEQGVIVYRQEDCARSPCCCRDCSQQVEWMFEYLDGPIPYLSHLNKEDYILPHIRGLAHKQAADQFVAASSALSVLIIDVAGLIKRIMLRLTNKNKQTDHTRHNIFFKKLDPQNGGKFCHFHPYRPPAHLARAGIGRHLKCTFAVSMTTGVQSPRQNLTYCA